MLAKRFEHILHDLGMAGLEHPLFYHAPVGIRFKIGGEEPIYLDRRATKLKTNPAYVQGALDRAAAIYRALPAVPELLRIDGYPDEDTILGWADTEGYPVDGTVDSDGQYSKADIPEHTQYDTQSLAKFAFSMFWRAMRFAEEQQVPILLDY